MSYQPLNYLQSKIIFVFTSASDFFKCHACLYNALTCICLSPHRYFPSFVIAVGYYGLSLNITAFAGNKYLNLFLAGLTELPASCLGVL